MKTKVLLFIFALCSFMSCEKTDSDLNDTFSFKEKKPVNKEAFDNLVSSYEANLKGIQSSGIKKNENITSSIETESRLDESLIKMIRDSVEKSFTKIEVPITKSAIYSPTVGVFKFTTCGGYGEFHYHMDNEDGGWTNIQGNVGATTVDKNKNVDFKFCLVPAITSVNYGGGVLLLSTYGWDTSHGDVDVVNRYHDDEDTGNANAVVLNNTGISYPNPNFNNWIGNCRFTENTIFAWRFSERKNDNLNFRYGVLTNSFTNADGTINIDDQNQGNSNGATLFRHVASTGTTTQRDLQINERFRGITNLDGNTIYHIKIYN